jgi:hypothetical protein
VLVVLLGVAAVHGAEEVQMLEDDLSEVSPIYEKHRQKQEDMRNQLDNTVATARNLAKIAFDTRKRADVASAKAALLKVKTETDALMKAVRTTPGASGDAMASVKVKSHPKGSISYPGLGIKMSTKKADGLMAPSSNAKKAWGKQATMAAKRTSTEIKRESSSTFSQYGMLNRILSRHGKGRGFGKVSVSGKKDGPTGEAALAQDLNKAKNLVIRASKTLGIVKKSVATQNAADKAGAAARLKYNQRMSRWERMNDDKQRLLSLKRLAKIQSKLNMMKSGFTQRPGAAAYNRRKMQKLNKKMDKIQKRDDAKNRKSQKKLNKTLRRLSKAKAVAPVASKKTVMPPAPRKTSKPAVSAKQRTPAVQHVKFNGFKKSRAQFKQLSKQAFDAAKRLHTRANKMQPKEEVTLGDARGSHANHADAEAAVRAALRATESFQGIH